MLIIVLPMQTIFYSTLAVQVQDNQIIPYYIQYCCDALTFARYTTIVVVASSHTEQLIQQNVIMIACVRICIYMPDT